jgi:nitroimidazol reductase NimA-like FMN-containing flavoprotein (pyridoxamine 5'-phosphate oxidase superfamily)
MEDEVTAGELTELDEDECWRLVAGLEIGRIAVTSSGLAPMVVPVNYVLDGKAVVFRSGAGSKLTAMLDGPASFEADFIDPVHRSGWSVLIEGAVEEIDAADLGHLRLQPWAGGPKPHWLRLVPMLVTGRCLHLPSFVVEGRGYV